jgi:hypothetical protein
MLKRGTPDRPMKNLGQAIEMTGGGQMFGLIFRYARRRHHAEVFLLKKGFWSLEKGVTTVSSRTTLGNSTLC